MPGEMPGQLGPDQGIWFRRSPEAVFGIGVGQAVRPLGRRRSSSRPLWPNAAGPSLTNSEVTRNVSKWPNEGIEMHKAMTFAGAAVIGLFLVVGPATAQVAPQTVELAKVNVQKLAAGYRASKVIGSSVINDGNETIGKIDDLLVSPDGKEPFAVLSIGGSRHGQSLGCGPLRHLEARRQKIDAAGRHKRKP
jgi:PRC-barrel domain